MVEVLFPEGRIVAGHPMTGFNPTDSRTKQPKMKKDGMTKVTQWNFGVAYPKNGQDWKTTDWGQKIVQAATDPVEGYTNGEINSPHFSWKVIDGDSTIPNKKGNVPCQQEGYPGNWIVFFSTEFQAPKCFHKDKYDPMQQIQNPDEIYKGDHVRVFATARGNKPSETAGVYINPGMVSLERKGERIESANAGPSAASVFGGAAPAPVSTPAPVGVTPPPATDLLVTPPPVEEKYNVNGTVYTRAQLLAMPGWTEAHLTNLPRA